jgi:hypothetical protein
MRQSPPPRILNTFRDIYWSGILGLIVTILLLPAERGEVSSVTTMFTGWI